jgi:hypothetical protein
MLNPSTADDVLDDPTIRRCIAFAQAWGYARLVVVNTNPCRSTDPKLTPFPTPEQQLDNDIAVLRETMNADRIVCAWGANVHPLLGSHMRALLADRTLYHLGLTKQGHPRHPLYLRSDTQPIAWVH